ncbi:PREDICTED: transmembrane protease serine 9-like [Nicrophorus vespilloides]|uniref:Transmembrane protease serine 9-like n=1 Tax=Nicrophorus vespilloides TaxID=110193 RepID=A0ABM1MQ02_NICVS|nr:PREDICTED: transmembrane protease serine 9-like [Nicrophorus vespilloides]
MMTMFTAVSAILLIATANCAPSSSNKMQTRSARSLNDNVITPNNHCNCVCGMSNRRMRVVGGNITRVHEFPWIAGLSRNGEFYCGASLITRKHLLTAAHCVNGFDIRGITVVLADHDRDATDRFSTAEVRGVKKVRQHRAFDAYSFNNDIAVLELDEPVSFSSKIQPACLPNTVNADYSGRLAVVAGWGRLGEREEVSPVLRKVAVPVWKKNDCYNSGYGEKRLSENMFCAGYPDGKLDACQGDSGGPLHMTNSDGDMEIIGVVSWGRGCARPNLPGIYTKVNNYLQWVQESLNGECMCPPAAYNRRGEMTRQTIIGSSVRSRSGTNATARFLFNQLFSIANLIGGVAGSDDDDDDDDDDARKKNCTCECGHSNQENRIVGGRPTGVNKYPWIARLVYDGHFHCGASLLTQDYVLTAAHCVRKLKRSKIRVVLGDHDQTVTSDAPAKMRAVASIIRHRNFDGDSYNHDIALLKLRKPVEFAKNIRPICLPSLTKNFDPAGKTGTVVGWGRTSEGGTLPGIVQEVQVPILSLSQCRAMKYRSSRITNYMLCAGRSSQDSCQGDSGGPLVIPNGDKFEIVGIVSWGVGCGRPGYPGVYTRVSKYLNWLKYNLENTCLCT